MMLRNGKRMSHSDRDFIINNGYIEQAVLALPSVPQSAPSCLQTTVVEAEFDLEPSAAAYQNAADCSQVESGIGVVRSRLLGAKARHGANHEDVTRLHTGRRQVCFHPAYIFLLSIPAMAFVWFLMN